MNTTIEIRYKSWMHSTSSLSAALFIVWRRVWPGAENAHVFKWPNRIRSNRAMASFCLASCSVALLCELPNVAQAQTSPRIVVWGDNTYGQTNVPSSLTNVIAIAAGGVDCMALKSDGTVVVWGYSRYGQTDVPAGLSNVIAIAVGDEHCLALRSNGTVVAWGSNYNYNGATNVPPGLSNVVAIAAGGYHSLALKSDGTITAWGSGKVKYPGTVDRGQSKVPTNLNEVMAIAAGEYHSLAVKSNGTVVAWGDNSAGQTNVPVGLNNVEAVAAGGLSSLALRSDGTVVAWGYHASCIPSGLSNVIAIADGGTSLALKSDGTVVAWGYVFTNVPTAAAGALAIAAGGGENMAFIGRVAILSQPTNQMVLLGSDVQLQAQVGGVAPVTNQWFFNATKLISGATNAILQLTNVHSSQSGAYTLVARNRYGAVTSAPAELTVVAAPVIVSQPTNQDAFFADTVNFSVAAVGVLPLSYHWFFGTDAVLGATNSALWLTNVQPWQEGAYTVMITNVYGAVTSAPAMLTVAATPIIACQPTNQNAFTGDTVNFSVMAMGAPPLAYQWFFGSEAILQATNATLQLTDLQLSQAGFYSVVITNAYGATTSSRVRLDVFSPVVRIASEAALRAALGHTNKVVFACDGTIILTGTITNTDDIVLDGSGHQIAISGNDSVRVFCNSTNARFTAINLAIVNGTGAGGAGILNLGGVVSLTGVSFRSNTAYADFSYDPSAPEASGGAILNRGGVVCADGCSFTSNRALTLDGFRPIQPQPTQVCGGAILNESGEMDLQSCMFVGNLAIGGAVTYTDAWSRVSGDFASGGAIYNSGTMTLNLCSLTGNMATGGGSPSFSTNFNDFIYINDFMGSQGSGGAIFNDGTMTVYQASFVGNSAIGGGGGYGSDSGAAFMPQGGYNPSYDGLWGGSGGYAYGGGIFNGGVLWISGSTLVSNVVTGGKGGWGGSGGLISDEGNVIIGGDGGQGGPGGDGLGGAVYNVPYGSASLVNCTIAFNQGTGGDGGAGGSGYWCPCGVLSGNGADGGNGGSSVGGIDGYCSLTNCTIAQNVGAGGIGGAGGVGNVAGLGVPSNGQPGASENGWGTTSNGWFQNTLIVSNTPAMGNDSFSDPMLGPLADNGGPTLTMALLPGSPAIDAGDTAAAPPTDQRGFKRPFGASADIGAYEFGLVTIATPPATQTAETGATTELCVEADEYPSQTYQWFFNDIALGDPTTNSFLYLNDLQTSQGGVYTVVVSNIFGVVTSTPALLNVIPPVEQRPVPAINLAGQAGTSLSVEFTDALGASANWLPLSTVSLTNPPQFCVDLTLPTPAQRFYRVWQTGTPGVTPSLDLHFVPAILLTGKIGDTVRLDYINAIGPTDAWVTLDTVTLTNTSQLYFDTSSIGQPRRLYRIVPAP